MNLDQFLTKYANKSNDYDGYYGAQCFDLFQFYNRDVVGAPFVTGDAAKDIWETYPRAFYERIGNEPTNYPVRGDVVIWGSGYGIYGHVAIVTEADVNTFTVLSQNDPIGVPSIYKTYTSWKGVLGWLRPKAQVEDPLTACLRMHKDAVTELDALKKTHAQCSMLTLEVSTLKQEVLILKKERNSLLNDLNVMTEKSEEADRKLEAIHAILT